MLEDENFFKKQAKNKHLPSIYVCIHREFANYAQYITNHFSLLINLFLVTALLIPLHARTYIHIFHTNSMQTRVYKLTIPYHILIIHTCAHTYKPTIHTHKLIITHTCIPHTNHTHMRVDTIHTCTLIFLKKTTYKHFHSDSSER